MVRAIVAVASQVAGVLLVLLTLADIFLTVLFPASGHGPLRRPLSDLVWHAFRGTARQLSTRRRRGLLAYAGPVLVGLSIAVWPVLLICGWALIYYPALGTGIVNSSGTTHRDWSTAFYFSGFSLTTLGTGDVVPAGGFWRWLTVTEAATGFAVVSMVITYFLSLYGAIIQRKTFAAAVDNRTGRTGDSARLVVALAAEGGVSSVVGQLASTGEFLQQMFQTHQSYPVLRWFHYRETRYALPRVLLVTLDTAALLSAALRRSEQGVDLTRGASLALVHGAADDLLDELIGADLPASVPAEQDERRWRARFAVASEHFRESGLDVCVDADAVDRYVRDRRRWDARLRELAGAMLYDWDEIEPSWRGDAAARD